MTTYGDMLYHLGGVPAGVQVPFSKNAKYYFVDPANGSDTNSGTSPAEALAGIEAAEAKTVANQHDVVFYIAGSSGNNLAAALTWDKNYTHLIGIAAPTRVAQRARIFQTSTLTGASPLLNITATGCIFKDFYIFQGVADATSLIDVQVTGGRNYFENVHFAGGGHATQAVNGGASLKITGEENTFVNCTIGVDTIEAATGMTAITFDGSAHRNTFENCLIQLYIGNAGAILVELIDSTSVDRWTNFNNCTFFSNSTNKATTMSSAFVIPAGHTTTATIFLRDCMGLGFTDWDADNRGIVYLNNGTETAGGNAGFALVSTSA
jgi:hypothetical protein